MAGNPGHSVPRLYAVKAAYTFFDRDEQLPTPAARAPGTGDGTVEGRAVGASSEPLPIRGRPLFELGDPYFEADEVLGEFAGRAYLNQFFYTRSVDPS